MEKYKKVIRKLKCLRCLWTWTPMYAKPKVCPRCKSYEWNKPRLEQESRAA